MIRRAWTWLLVACALWLIAAPAFAHDTVYYYISDSLHSEVVVTDQSRNVVEQTYYAPYGQVLNRELRDGPGYTGHAEDPATGLVYMQQRYYDPQAGRFLSVDPVAADSTTGANFNRYWYASDSPYRYTDPDGRCAGGMCDRMVQSVGESISDSGSTTLSPVAKVGLAVMLTATGVDEAAGVAGALRVAGRYVAGKIAGTVTRNAAKGTEDAFTGKGGVKGAVKEFERASGKEIRVSKQGVRVKIRSNGERVEMHDSTGKNPAVPSGTRTIKIQDPSGKKILKTVRYPEPKPPRELP